MPSSRPRVSFNKDQICNGCLHQFEKKEINWDDRKKNSKKSVINLDQKIMNMIVSCHGVAVKIVHILLID